MQCEEVLLVERHLYIMLSRSPSCMGRFIRFFTPGDYNHVSLSVDDTLTEFVSFARYVQDVPLAGGYIREPAERLLAACKPLPVRIFRLPITQKDAQALEQLFGLAGNASAGLIYNSAGALLSALHIPCPIPGAYTCLDFAKLLLGVSCSNIRALEAILSPWEFFCGDYRELVMPVHCSGPFFARRGFLCGCSDTLSHFGRLLLRILRLQRIRDPLPEYRLNLLEKCKCAVSE